VDILVLAQTGRALASRLLRFLSESLEHPGPAAIDRVAHLFAWLGTHLLELAMFELNPCGVGAIGDEPDLDFGADRRVGLPLAVDVPAHDDALGRLPGDDPADIRLGTVLGELVPAAARTGFHDRRFHRQLADADIARPPAPKARGED